MICSCVLTTVYNSPRRQESLPNLRPTLTPAMLGRWGKDGMGSSRALAAQLWPHKGRVLVNSRLLRAEQAVKKPPWVLAR